MASDDPYLQPVEADPNVFGEESTAPDDPYLQPFEAPTSRQRAKIATTIQVSATAVPCVDGGGTAAAGPHPTLSIESGDGVVSNDLQPVDQFFLDLEAISEVPLLNPLSISDGTEFTAKQNFNNDKVKIQFFFQWVEENSEKK